MSFTEKLSSAAASAMLDAMLAMMNGGTLKVYDGAQPASVDTPVTTQNVLLSMDFGTPAFEPAVDGVADLATPLSGSWLGGGPATWFRIYSSGGVAVRDGSVGIGSYNLNMAPSNEVGSLVNLESLIMTQRKERG